MVITFAFPNTEKPGVSITVDAGTFVEGTERVNTPLTKMLIGPVDDPSLYIF